MANTFREFRSLLLCALHIRQLLDGLLNDAQRALELFFRNDQWWCEADDVLVRWFGLWKSRGGGD